MNIFATYDSPIDSALALDDIRMNKMIVESAQMLSTALAFNAFFHADLYKPCYENHPCTVWTRKSRKNFLWLCNHAMAMCAIFRMINGYSHKTERVIDLASKNSIKVREGELTEFADCTTFKHRTDIPVIDRYKLFMNEKWDNDVIKLTFKRRSIPSFMVNTGKVVM